MRNIGEKKRFYRLYFRFYGLANSPEKTCFTEQFPESYWTYRQFRFVILGNANIDNNNHPATEEVKFYWWTNS